MTELTLLEEIRTLLFNMLIIANVQVQGGPVNTKKSHRIWCDMCLVPRGSNYSNSEHGDLGSIRVETLALTSESAI